MKRFWPVLFILAGLLGLAAAPGTAQKKEPTLRDLQKVAQQEPQNPQVHYMLGLKYEIEGFPKKALQAYQQALSLKPDYPEALYRWGELKGLEGDREGAIKALSQAVKLRSDFKEAKAALGTVYGQKGAALLEQGNWADAARSLQEAVALNPEDDAAYNNLGAAYVGQGDWERAIEAFRAAIEINPGNANAHFNLGSAFLRTGNKNGVLGQYAVLGNLDSALAGELFAALSFPKGKTDSPYETPQHGQTGIRPSLPSSVAPSPAYLEEALRRAPDLQGPAFESKLPAGQLR
jgi:tetratricopeptide (TPR) repeat protein